MKKFVFLSLALASLAVSCSDDTSSESATPTREVISFDNLFVDKSTRSIVDPSTNIKNLNEMTVFGYMDSPNNVVFNNQEVKIVNGTGTYSPEEYWEAGHKYVFKAVSPLESANLVIQHDGGSIKSLNLTNTTTTDVLYASAIVTTPADFQSQKPSPVEFTFRHLLSKVKFSVQNGFTNPAYTIEVKDIKINNAFKKGIYDMRSWSGSDPTLIVDFGTVTVASQSGTNNTQIPANAEWESYYERFLVPSDSFTAYEVTFTANLFKNGEQVGSYAHTATIKNVTLQSGYAYNFKVVLTPSNINPDAVMYPIEFTVTEVDNWVENGPSDL